MRTLHIVMAMAGRGSRFANAGFTTPKPLIEVDGQPMFLKALSSFDPIDAPKAYTIIIREEHDAKYGLRDRLKQELPEANIVMTNAEPIGATRDALRSEPHLKSGEGVVIMDCDFWFESKAYNQMVDEALADKSDVEAGLLTFKADHPRYSYAETDKDNYVIRTAEKQVISPNAIWGAYFFNRSETFIEAANELLAQPLTEAMKEYYISPLYNIILKSGKRVKAAPVDKFGSFGTPEELSEYVGHTVQPS